MRLPASSLPQLLLPLPQQVLSVGGQLSRGHVDVLCDSSNLVLGCLNNALNVASSDTSGIGCVINASLWSGQHTKKDNSTQQQQQQPQQQQHRTNKWLAVMLYIASPTQVEALQSQASHSPRTCTAPSLNQNQTYP
jgi:hypothetical protein